MVGILVVTACSSDSDLDDPPRPAAEVEFASSIVGRYAERTVVATIDSTPAGTTKTIGSAYGFVELLMDQDKLMMVETYCHMDMLTTSPLQLSIPDAMVHAIIPEPAPVGLTKSDEGWEMLRPSIPVPVGIKLEDHNESILEVSPDDPRIFDADDDGHPGVSMQVSGRMYGIDIEGEVYLIRRESFEYVATAQEDGKFIGVVNDSSEQVVIGASRKMLNVQIDAYQDPDKSRSPFVLTPVSAAYDCERLLAEKETLFDALPTP